MVHVWKRLPCCPIIIGRRPTFFYVVWAFGCFVAGGILSVAWVSSFERPCLLTAGNIAAGVDSGHPSKRCDGGREAAEASALRSLRQFPKSEWNRRKARGKPGRDGNMDGGQSAFVGDEPAANAVAQDPDYEDGPVDRGDGGDGVRGPDVESDGSGDKADSCPARIPCVINEEYSIDCKQDGSEVYVPFSFLHKYFEVYGKLVEGNDEKGGDRTSGPHFEWSHSYSSVFYSKTPYDPTGPMAWFQNYDVEVRDRVKAVSAKEGVPVSVQWSTSGYFYPIQIAQFALSHYSKHFADGVEMKPRTSVYFDGENKQGSWKIPDSAHVERIFDKDMHTHYVEFSVKAKENVDLSLESSSDLVLKMDFQPVRDMSLFVKIEDRGKPYYLVYTTTSEEVIRVEDDQVIYGMGKEVEGKWHKFVRDLGKDLQKGFAPPNLNGGNARGNKSNSSTSRKKIKFKRSALKVVMVSLRGQGKLDNVTLSSSGHMETFFTAADWFVKAQDTKGGWSVPVQRRMAGGALKLDPGWYSAMAQGQALSVLARAYHSSGNEKYAEAASAGLDLFGIPSSSGGVRAEFMGKHPWYEEYPTTPSSFVLNGFMYALMGLYDAAEILPEPAASRAGRLYREGMTSLKALLPLFDTGSGSVYDLRHMTLAGSGVPPNLARWDYHATHINQLLLLGSVDPDPGILTSVAKRWVGYMSGKRAPHN